MAASRRGRRNWTPSLRRAHAERVREGRRRGKMRREKVVAEVAADVDQMRASVSTPRERLLLGVVEVNALSARLAGLQVRHHGVRWKGVGGGTGYQIQRHSEILLRALELLGEGGRGPDVLKQYLAEQAGQQTGEGG